MNNFWIELGFFILAAIGLTLWFAWQRKSLEMQREQTLLDTKKRSEEYLEEGRKKLEEFTRLKEENYREKEEALTHREGLIGLQLQGILEQETNLKQRQERLDEREADIAFSRKNLNEEIEAWRKRLSQTAGISIEGARDMLMREVERSAANDALKLSKRILENAENTAKEHANRILAAAIQRCAIAHTMDIDSSVISLPNEEIKGRIIGREGRNIKAFENQTGVTVLVDDSPNTIILSGLDPIRREIAKRAMLTMVKDGRINPTRIEEVVNQSAQQVEEIGMESAQDAIDQVGLTLLPDSVMKMLGRLKFRYSYSQNILSHSIEVAHLSGLLAGELGLNVTLAKRAGLLHDIGKAVTHETEGGHAKAGAEFLERNMESPEIVDCVAKHHESITLPDPSPLLCIIAAADAVSAARPGARLENMETYIKRFKQLEAIGKGLPAVDRCFALQAGREFRVFVKPEQATDEQCSMLAKYLATKIQNELQYPGQIRITIIREHRCEIIAE